MIPALKILMAMVMALAPISGFANEDAKTLTPEQLFKSLKDNVTVPFDVSEIKEGLPTPDEALEKITPKLKELGRGVEEEAGIDVPKFLSWLAGILQWLFRIIVDALQSLAEVFES
jgi:hypothetical protein